MSYHRDISQPLLAEAASVSTPIVPPDTATASTSSRVTLSFFREYQSLGGVPTLHLKPLDDDNKFTSHAFSSDGSRWITGENDGSIRLWTTVDYSVLLTVLSVFDRTIDCLSFLDGRNDAFVAVDTRGNIKECSFVLDASSVGSSSRIGKLQILRETETGRFDEDGRRLHIATRQFSDDGRTCVCGPWRPEQPIDLYRFGQSVQHLTIDGTLDFKYRFPILSKNGNALLLTGEKTSGRCCQCVWPTISFTDAPSFIELKGDRGLWGKGGVYFMVWQTVTGKPQLTVYKTDAIHSPDAAAVHRCLEHGLLRWTAQMMDSQGISIVIHTISTSGKQRVLLWDVTSDFMKHEVILDMHLTRSIDTSRWKLFGLPADAIIESVAQPKSAESFFGLMMEDLHSKLCVSKDGVWVGTFSWSVHAGAVCSLSSSSTVWNFVLPEETTYDPFQMSNQVFFDPTGRRFILLGDAGIFVSAPCFLHPTDDGFQQVACVGEDGLFDEVMFHPWNTFGHLPSMAFSVAWTAGGASKEWKIFPDRPKMIIHTVRDIAISQNGSLLAIIVYIDRELYVVTSSASQYQSMFQSGIFHPNGVPLDETFDPARVFLYTDKTNSDAVVLLAAGFKGILAFCNLEEKSMTTVALDMERCNKITQTTDHRRLIMLDNNSVCIVDLWEKQMTERIVYAANLRRMINLTLRGRRWMPERIYYRERTSERRLSEDGHAVLMAWDTKNNRSILLTPSMPQKVCEAMVKSDEKFLSECCVLSRNGEVTLFVDIDALSIGRLTIGIFDESIKCVTYRVEVGRNLPKAMSSDLLRHFLANVFYDVTPDGATLVTATTPIDQPSEVQMQPCVTKFGVRGAESYIVGYDQITADTHSNVKTTTMELFEKFGGSVFNASANGRTSFFQEAVHRRHWDIVSHIQEMAVKNDTLLSFDRLDAASPLSPNHWLLQSLLTASTNDVRKALHLLCSRTTPFDRAAAGINAAFKILSFKHPEIMQEMLSKSLLIFQTCTLDVHVDFMNRKLGNDRAVHIDTSNTYSEWTTIDNPAAMEKNWRKKNEEIVSEMEQSGNASTMKATLIFVRIRDAAKVGMRGIIRPLLLQKAPAHVFKFDVVKYVIMYKWLKIWKLRFITNAGFYVCFLLDYTLYVILISQSSHFSDASHWMKIWSTVALFIAVIFGLKMLMEEITQLGTFIKEGREQKRGWTWGVRYHFSSRWNWVDTISCLLLLIFLPLFHCLVNVNPIFEYGLSAAAAIEAIVAYLKMWYFAQPFREMGALVLMVNNIFRDCVAFLALAAIVLFGFGLGLHVLFRHVKKSHILYEEVYDAFGTFEKTLTTMFYALLGQFEPEIFNSAGPLSRLIVFVFLVFLVTESIVLLNLLIAIMGDTFDKVKSTEESHLLMGRAIFIDACEAALGQREADALNGEIGKYVHVLVSQDEQIEIDPTRQWMGKMAMLEESFRSAIRKSQQRLQELIERQSQQTENIAKTAAETTHHLLELQEAKLAGGPTAEAMSSNQPDIEALLQLHVEQTQQKLETLLEGHLQQLENKTTSQAEVLHHNLEEQKLNLTEVANKLSEMVTSNSARLEQLETKMEEMDGHHTQQLNTILSLLQTRQDT